MTRQGNDKGSHAEAAARRLRSFDLHVAGASYRAIGKELGISEAQAHRDVQATLATLAKLEHDTAEVYRTVELARLDVAQLSLASKVRTGNVEAINAWVRVSESRRKLLGLDQQPPLGMGPYELSGSDRIRAIIGLLDAARDRAARSDVIDATPEPDGLAAGDNA
jgi:hypothetical protein